MTTLHETLANPLNHHHVDYWIDLWFQEVVLRGKAAGSSVVYEAEIYYPDLIPNEQHSSNHLPISVVVLKL